MIFKLYITFVELINQVARLGFPHVCILYFISLKSKFLDSAKSFKYVKYSSNDRALFRYLKNARPVSVVVNVTISSIRAEISHLSLCDNGNSCTFCSKEIGSIWQYTKKYCTLIFVVTLEHYFQWNNFDFFPFFEEKIVCHISRRCLQDIDIPALLIFLRKNQNITRLNLASNNITDPGFINLIDHFLLHKNVQELDIGNNNIANIGINYMLKVGNNLELRNLNLRANKFGDQASKNVALFLLKNTHMQSLNVADVNQTASGLIYFVMTLSSDQLLSNRTLKRLDISRPNPGFMYYFDSTHFADLIGHMLKHNTTLAALHLQKYNFSCHDIESMMRNAKCNNWLHLLDLGCNNIGDHGIDHICAWLIKRPALKTLILHRNIITDHGARSLSFAIPSSKLLTLDISYNRITDDGMVNILYTLKKSPMLRQLRIFGNCIGHPAAKIVKRMLISQVLEQENIDVRPYIVDHKWYFAKYEGDRCKNEYWNIPYKLFKKPKETSLPSHHKIRKYYKYTYTRATDIKLQYSAVTLISNIISSHQVVDCKCCYCLKSEECRNADHPDSCTCCKCKGDESSDWSIDKSVLKQMAFPYQDSLQKNIKYILKRVNSTTRENILRWISIDKDILEEDLKLIDDPNASEESIGTTVSCKCSYVQMSIPTLQKYLQESSLKNFLIIPRDNSICLNNSCQDIVTFVSFGSLTPLPPLPLPCYFLHCVDHQSA
ncbi:uncharacterized protein LOC143427239 [Xylocopa sonorina]|uniref:uncharacterized protein LOC143427239 n=1 Tax=Xylocopa sonorina TaxID=1818115 RepID=UPI00403B0DB0